MGKVPLFASRCGFGVVAMAVTVLINGDDE
jgi:hypothetical protein